MMPEWWTPVIVSMTGVGGRPELIIEGSNSNDQKANWKVREREGRRDGCVYTMVGEFTCTFRNMNFFINLALLINHLHLWVSHTVE